MTKALENKLGSAQRPVERAVLGTMLRDRKNDDLTGAQTKVKEILTVDKNKNKCNGRTHMQRGKWAMDEKDNRLGNC